LFFIAVQYTLPAAQIKAFGGKKRRSGKEGPRREHGSTEARVMGNFAVFLRTKKAAKPHIPVITLYFHYSHTVFFLVFPAPSFPSCGD
jgi:hypothetical protein